MNPNDLSAYWMPFTANRQFKQAPRLFKAARDMHYTTVDGRRVLDATAGLWCVNAGHCRPRIVEAIQAQAAEMDYSTAFQMGHPKAFELASRLAAMSPGDLDHVFYTNSGSEAVETALKMALAYHRAQGDAGRVRLIGRDRGYHGVGFGGIAVGGMAGNKRQFAPLFAGVDHLPHTHLPAKNAFSRGEPQHGIELAEELEKLIALHDASTIAAVIVEPVAGSTGVLIPPPGYLKRLREICDRHGILLIFDEVITGFGRLGAPFGADRFGVLPDLMTVAKGITNGAVPMGAVFAREHVHDAFMQGPPEAIELAHGYTYSGHPLACAAALATLDVYREEDLFGRARKLEKVWEDGLHGLKDVPGVVDIRNIGLVGAIELSPDGGKRAFATYLKCFEEGLLIRTTGDVIALSPPLIATEAHLGEIIDGLRKGLKATA